MLCPWRRRAFVLAGVGASRYSQALMAGDSRGKDDTSAPRAAAPLTEVAGQVAEWLRWEAIVGGVGVLPARPVAPVAVERTAPAAATSPGPSASSAGALRAASAAAQAADAADALPPGLEGPAGATREERARRLALIDAEVKGCTKCGLAAGRTHTVFARGNPAAELVFVGEGPGANEDEQGIPFVGKAGQLLDKMIGAMGVRPTDVYICNVVKCRPPDNRTPQPNEANACLPYLVAQLDVVRPRAIVALGRCAAENLGATTPEGRDWRGKWTEWRGVPVLSTYHPAYLLRNENMKRPVWEDLQGVMKRLGWGRG